jgi:CP family cyanate transporter-like MFS transporter
MKRRIPFFTVVSLICISLVLRPPIAAVGPLLHEISAKLNLDAAQAGLLTSIPVFCFGLGAFLSPWMMRRYGLNHSMFAVLLILLLGIVGRLWFGFSVLLLGTVMVGLSIAVANVLLPTLVRTDFQKRASLLTSVYTTILAMAASFTAAIAVVWSDALGGWQFALLVVAAPALFAILFWLPRLWVAEPHIQVAAHLAKDETRAVYRSPIAWAILGFFGFQSLGFYALLGWLPTMLISVGLDPAAAGGYLGLATAIGIPSGFALAPLISRLKKLSWLIAIASSLTTSGFALLAFTMINGVTANLSLLVIASILISVGQTATFPMSLSLIATRASTQGQTTVLSAFSQGWGYLISGLGTFALGAAAAALGDWSVVAIAMAAISLVQIAIGFYAGRDSHIAAK